MGGRETAVGNERELFDDQFLPLLLHVLPLVLCIIFVVELLMAEPRTVCVTLLRVFVFLLVHSQNQEDADRFQIAHAV